MCIKARNSGSPSRSILSSSLSSPKDPQPECSIAALKVLFPPPARPKPGIHPGALVDENASLGADVSIGPFVVVEAGARIGDRTVLAPFVYVGAETVIGADCLLYPHVSVRERCVLGDRVIVHCGAVIGSDGYGYVQIGNRHEKIPQVGTVEIGDDVEIGANVCVDRARFDKTHICKGAKIDNLVQIGHNVVVGEHACIVALSGIAGSTRLGRGVTMAAQSGVLGHIDVGDNVIIAARGGVIKDVPAGSVVAGYPHTSLADYRASKVAVRRLPGVEKRLRQIEKRLEKIERRADNAEDD